MDFHVKLHLVLSDQKNCFFFALLLHVFLCQETGFTLRPMNFFQII
jgi:hypothetical protein